MNIECAETTLEPRLGRSVSIDQAAFLLNVSRRTIYNRIREGRLLTNRTLGGSQRVLVESLVELELNTRRQFFCQTRPQFVNAGVVRRNKIDPIGINFDHLGALHF